MRSTRSSRHPSRSSRYHAVAGLAALAGATCLATFAFLTTPSFGSPSTQLVGTFLITPGSCSGTTVSGSYFRMILSGGNTNGPFLSNSASTCSDKTYTAMSPGTDGGLITGSYQPMPNPPFDSSGNSLANRITLPASFYGVKYSVSTNPTDPQTGIHVPAPAIVANGDTLSGDLRAISVSWNKQYFNQGSPKPDGSFPGNTTRVTGTYDPATGAFTLRWTSQVVGGPFNGFAGLWNMTGRFAASGESSPGAGGRASSGSTATSSGGKASNGATPTATNSSSPTGGSSGAGGAQAAAGSVGSGTSSPGSQGDILATRSSIARGGWQAPRWLVVLVAAAGVSALFATFLFDRRLRRLRAAGEPPR